MGIAGFEKNQKINMDVQEKSKAMRTFARCC